MERIEPDALRDLAGTEGPLTLRVRALDPRASSGLSRSDWGGPVSVVWPESVEAISRLVAYAHARGAKVLAIGGGSSLRSRHDDLDPSEIEIEDASQTSQRAELGRTIGAVITATGVAPDLVVSTQRLVRVLEYSPADLVARAECGLSFAALQQHLARSGQRVPLDPMFPFEAAGRGAAAPFEAMDPFGETTSTVGGVLATNAFGVRRLRSGTARDWVLGTRLVRFDGAVVQAGGRVVKNVSGYDLTKLYLGSMGAFGILVDAFFKLEPIPDTRGVLTAARSPSDDKERSVALVRQWLDEPWPLAWTLFTRVAKAPPTFSACFEGLPEAVVPRGERLQDLARASGFEHVSWQVSSQVPRVDFAATDDPPFGVAEFPFPTPGSVTPDLRNALDGGLVVRIHHLPAEHVAFDRRARDAAPEAWSDAIECTLLGAGISWLHWPALVTRARPEAAWREDFLHLRRTAVSLGGHLVVERAPRGWFADFSRLDVQADPRRMMARLLRALDPSDTFLPGMHAHELRSSLS